MFGLLGKGARTLLTLFRRHLKSCPHKTRRYRRCQCPLHVEGSLAGQNVRKALDLKSWEAATATIRRWESQGFIGDPERPSKLISEARTAYLDELRARNVSLAARRKFELLLGNLEADAVHDGLKHVDELTPDHVRNFRLTWTWGPRTSVKYLERLKSFFRFAVRFKWTAEDPTLNLKPPKVPPPSIEPFEPEELQKIIGMCERPRLRALVFLLQYSGLRISDAVKLERANLKDGRLRLTTQKTGAQVYLPLPPFVVSALESVESRSRRYFFWTGEGKLSSAIGNWRADLDALFEKAEIKGNPHKFRHTFATTLLANGTPVDRVAMLLGNSPKIVEKHYSHWVKARQDALEADVKKTWPKSKLVRLK